MLLLKQAYHMGIQRKIQPTQPFASKVSHGKWGRFYSQYIGSPEYFSLSPQSFSFYKRLLPLLSEYARGRTLDAGAGDMSCAFLLKPRVQEYISMDIEPHNRETIQGDIQAMQFADQSFDTVFCCMVLEHVPYPDRAVQEMSRILRANGCVILVVPHLGYLHGEPHDYWRFTQHGIHHLAKQAGLAAEVIKSCGGFFSFITTPVSILILSYLGSAFIVGPLVRALNRLGVKSVDWLDTITDRQHIYAYNYVAVLRKVTD